MFKSLWVSVQSCICVVQICFSSVIELTISSVNQYARMLSGEFSTDHTLLGYIPLVPMSGSFTWQHHHCF